MSANAALSHESLSSLKACNLLMASVCVMYSHNTGTHLPSGILLSRIIHFTRNYNTVRNFLFFFHVSDYGKYKDKVCSLPSVVDLPSDLGDLCRPLALGQSQHTPPRACYTHLHFALIFREKDISVTECYWDPEDYVHLHAHIHKQR